MPTGPELVLNLCDTPVGHNTHHHEESKENHFDCRCEGIEAVGDIGCSPIFSSLDNAVVLQSIKLSVDEQSGYSDEACETKLCAPQTPGKRWPLR
jgi:hypothetical protein